MYSDHFSLPFYTLSFHNFSGNNVITSQKAKGLLDIKRICLTLSSEKVSGKQFQSSVSICKVEF